MPSTLTTIDKMVKSAAQASDNYEQGVRNVGERAYKEAAQADTPKQAAETLQSAANSGEHLSISSMVQAYQDAYE